MGRKLSLAGCRTKNRWCSTKTSKAKDNPTNFPDPPENAATVENAKDPLIHTSNQRDDNSVINLDAALGEHVINETPPNELKTNTVDQRKNLLLL